MNINKLRPLVILLTLLNTLLYSCSHPKAAKDTAGTTLQPAAAPAAGPDHRRHIVFFGTSLTAGLGVNPEQAYPALIQQKIDSLKLPYQVINAGLSGETSSAGKTRIGWVLRQPAAVFVLEIGANDGLRGLPVALTAENLQSITDQIRTKYPEARLILAGMQMPPSMGETYTRAFKNIFPALSQKNHMALIPFLLQDVGGVSRLNQQDGIHPNPAGHRILAETVWKVLQPELSAQP